MTINISISTDLDGLIKQLSSFENGLRIATTEILVESGKIVEKNIKKELLSPKKSGVANPNQRSRTSFRRSKTGESLAYDQGVLIQLVASSKETPTEVSVGFLKNNINSKGDYARIHETKNNRPTIEKAALASYSEIETLFDRKINSK